MNIRHAEEKDFDRLMEIFAHAREMMRRNGNPTQWGDCWPDGLSVKEDFALRQNYVIEDEVGHICATFAFIIGPDPTYAKIDGAWLNDLPYGTIHRVASDNSVPHMGDMLINYCEGIMKERFGSDAQYSMRADTHEHNIIVQHLLEKNGFKRCGIILIDREFEPERIAYQR